MDPVLSESRESANPKRIRAVLLMEKNGY